MVLAEVVKGTSLAILFPAKHQSHLETTLSSIQAISQSLS